MSRAQNSLAAFKAIHVILWRNPKLLVPFFICWLFYAPIVLVDKYYWPYEVMSTTEILLTFFLKLVFFSVIFSWAALTLCELIKQIEYEGKASILKGYSKSTVNVLRALPIAVAWATLWFILCVIEALTKRKNDRPEDREAMTSENVSKTLSGWHKVSLHSEFFRILKKGLRMAVFLILPAIAWEKMNALQSTKKGLFIARTHMMEFTKAFLLSEFALFVVFLPVAIFFKYADGMAELGTPVSETAWRISIAYVCIAWSYALFIEQIIVAELYLWHLIWEKEVEKAESNSLPPPSLSDVKRPSLIDDVNDFELTDIAARV